VSFDRLLPTFIATAFVSTLGYAGPTDQAIVAAMKIVEAPNYTWTVSTPSAGRVLPVREGKSQKNGYTLVTFIEPQSPMLRLISRLNDGTVTVAEGDTGHATCTIKVMFKPTTKGGKSAVLNVNGGGGGLRSVKLSGTGT